MDPDLKRRVEALRRPLELAAADGFAGVRKVAGLGNALRAACDGVLARIALDTVAGLDVWRATLSRWEQLDEQQQAVEVARGMRLLARLPRTGPPPPPRPTAPTFTIPGKASSTNPPPTNTASATSANGRTAPTLHGGTAPTTTVAKPTSANGRTLPVANRGTAPTTNVAKPTSANGRTAPTMNGGKPGKDLAAEAKDVVGDPLAAPTSSLPGIGPAFAEKLTERGLTTVEDLLWLVPRRYDDVRDARQLADVVGLPEGVRATFVAQVASARMVFARGRRWAEVRLGSVDVARPASALVRWFNVFAGIDKRMPPGSRVALSGLVRKRGGRLELANPDILGIEVEAAKLEGGEGEGGGKRPMPAILARYPDVPGVPPGRVRSACATACGRVAGSAEDGVPPAIERAAGLPSLAETLAQLHAPPADSAAEDIAAMNRGDSRWQRRLAFGELFALGVAITLRRRERCADAAVPCARAPEVDRLLTAALPFTLTGAQRRTIGEIAGDLARASPMNRLLQGDVGAGKTAVAFAAALQVARAGRQTAVMAPTELLAEQHAETWRGWAKTSKLRLELLTASTPRGVRASILALLAAGQLDVVIGTHALIAESVGFGALGLVVIDEQHRFGVAQRAKLRDKGDGQGAPHLLVMTATPIPRTLALTAYGDLDASVLDELPPGRLPVATTVIEVGVDVPAATVMVIHDAERFGLAQLHQLRGRVGRGGAA
ncbi:MAG TPA: DEAD/DEAH box helicase, partial [Kofleriaceae bacterium]|nr:DEAD/DEAH box helicase [Kofleriaceae bacterium]